MIARMKATITFEIEYDLYSELSEKERLSTEKTQIELDAHEFVEDSIVENRYVKTNVVIAEIKEK